MGAACVLCLWETTGWNACHLLRCHISFMHEKMCFSKLNTEQLKRANSVMWCGAIGGGVLINSWNFPQKQEDGNLFIYNLETGVLWPKHLVFVLKKVDCFVLLFWPREHVNGVLPEEIMVPPPPNKNSYTPLIIYTCNPKSYKCQCVILIRHQWVLYPTPTAVKQWMIWCYV